MIRAIGQAATDVFTVPELARRLRVNQNKILVWLRSGELVGFNVAATTASRPKWRVSVESLAMFERARSSVPSPKAERPRTTRQAKDFVEYF